MPLFDLGDPEFVTAMEILKREIHLRIEALSAQPYTTEHVQHDDFMMRSTSVRHQLRLGDQEVYTFTSPQFVLWADPRFAADFIVRTWFNILATAPTR